MLYKLNQFIARMSTGRAALVAVVGSIAFLVPYFAIPYKDLLAKGILIDQTFNFSAADVHRILSSYTVVERAQYIRAEIVDLFVPLVTIAVAVIVSYGFKRMGWKTSWNLVPLFAGVFNDAKTLLMFPIISNYPHESAGLIAIINLINMAKIILLAASVSLLLVAIVAIAISYIRKNSGSG